MMRALVIGAGKMGSAIAFDLLRSADVSEVLLVDMNFEQATQVAQQLARLGRTKVRPARMDVNYYDDVIEAMAQCDVAISAVPYHYNYLLSKAALEAGVHFCDLGGSDETVAKQLSLKQKAKEVGITVIPNCGLAPGLVNILAVHGTKQLDTIEEMHLRVGGLPQHPQPPLNYQLVFSVEGLIKEYTEKAKTLRGGKITEVEPLTEVETIHFPPPFDTLEAFHTSGGASLLPEMFQGKIKTLDYKTIRYAGHAEKIRALLEVGFANSEPITIGDHLATPREMFAELLKRKIDLQGKDVVLLRATLCGQKNGQTKTLNYESIDYYHEQDQLTAMMRATAFPTSIIAQMIGRGQIHERGVFTPEMCVPGKLMLEELAKRDIHITESWS